ncbi:MAG: hypothetical protein ACOXZK_04935 [Bacteroidales bacterium]|jgi:uncharacterized integral membrane protein|nr:LapA family protein [Bacteroidales bacterium]
MKELIKSITLKQVVSTILIIFLVIFVMMNLNPIEVSLIFTGVTMPLVILITFVFFIGYFVGRTVKKSKTCKEEKREAKLKKVEEDSICEAEDEE